MNCIKFINPNLNGVNVHFDGNRLSAPDMHHIMCEASNNST